MIILIPALNLTTHHPANLSDELFMALSPHERRQLTSPQPKPVNDGNLCYQLVEAWRKDSLIPSTMGEKNALAAASVAS